jgi:hypothetical protein
MNVSTVCLLRRTTFSTALFSYLERGTDGRQITVTQDDIMTLGIKLCNVQSTQRFSKLRCVFRVFFKMEIYIYKTENYIPGFKKSSFLLLVTVSGKR